MERRKGLWIGVFLAFFLSSNAVWAGNVDTYGIGAKATALGGAFTARADDFSAVYYNPAGLVQLERPQISFGASFVDAAVSSEVNFRNDYDRRDGKYVKDDTHLLVYPHGGVVYPFKLFGKKAAFAVGTYVPYGLWLRWEPDPKVNAAAYNTYESWYYRVVNAAPTFAIQLTDRLSVGFGLTFGNSHSGVKRRIYASPYIQGAAIGFGAYSGSFSGTFDPLNVGTINALWNGLVPIPGAQVLAQQAAGALLLNTLKDGKMKTTAVDDFNWSWNVGLLYKIRDNLQVGLCYRGLTKTRFWVRTHVYDGDGNRVEDVRGHTNIDHPDQLQGGIYWSPFRKLHMEFDVTWTNWSRISHYRVRWNRPLLYRYLVDNGIDESLASEITTDNEDFPRHWRNTVQYRFGVEYELLDWLALRAGYYYDPTPIPEKTADATWPDADKRTFAFGTGLKLFGGKLIVDTTYQFTMTDGRRIIGWGDSDNLNESYGTESENPEAQMVGRGYVHNITVTLTYVF